MNTYCVDTLRISGEIELGPLDEKSETTGAGEILKAVSLGKICTLVTLHVAVN